MFPRRSSVIKYLFTATIAGVLFLLLVTGPQSTTQNGSLWQHMVEEWQLLQINESDLRHELNQLRHDWNFTFNGENKTVVDIYRYLQSMKNKIPVNPHRFRFLLNPTNICTQNKHPVDVFLLAYIHTAPDHYRRRTAIRETWGNLRNFEDAAFRIVFLMGKPINKSVQEAVQMESDIYGDIVQEDFVDSYRNLTYKAIMGLRWITNHCSQAKYILKADDDIFVNIFNVMNHFRSVAKHEGVQKNLIQCLVWSRMKVVRDPRSKWYIPRKEFPHDYFPTYCSGSAYMFTGDMIPKMYNASFFTPFFWVDDFYITGLLASKVNASYRRFNSVYSLGPSTFLTKFSEESKWRTLTFGHVHNLDWWFEVWRKVLKDRRIKDLTVGNHLLKKLNISE